MKDMEQKLDQLLKCEYGEMTIRREGQDYVVESPAHGSFWYRARLIDASGMPGEKEIGFFDPYELKDEVDGYMLTGQISDLGYEDEEDVELRFSDAETTFGNLRLEPVVRYGRPWQCLADCGRELLHKAEMAEELLNDRERAILPMLRELGMVTGYGSDADISGFDHLRARFTPELHPYLDQMVCSAKNWKKYRKYAEKLLNRLNRIEYLPLWRKIRDEIADTQTDYPASVQVSPEVVRKIEEGLHSRGYSGCYPEFVKTGTIGRSRVLKSHGTYRWVRKGTPAVFYIRVLELNIGQLQFLCGTELLPDVEQSLGLDSCGFDARGRRFLRDVTWTEGDDLDRKLHLVAKKAELRKLTRQEKDFGELCWPLFLVAFLGVGGFFAFVLTIGMALVAGLVSLLFGGADAMWNVLSALPYGKVFWFTLVTVGGTLGAMLLLNLDE